MSRNHSIDYVEFPVHDVAVAKAFYEKAFGWRFNDYGPEYAGIQGADREVGGLRLDANRPPRGGSLPILYSDSLESTLEAVRGAGGTITQPIFSFPGGRRFHFTDPSGNELAVWSQA